MFIQQLDDMITKLWHKWSANLTLSQGKGFFFESLHSLPFCKPCQSSSIDSRSFIIRIFLCQIGKISPFTKSLINWIDFVFYNLLFLVRSFLPQPQQDMCNMNTAFIWHRFACFSIMIPFQYTPDIRQSIEMSILSSLHFQLIIYEAIGKHLDTFRVNRISQMIFLIKVLKFRLLDRLTINNHNYWVGMSKSNAPRKEHCRYKCIKFHIS